MKKKLYIVDGHYQVYRAFFSRPDRLTSPSGEPTGATHIFCMMLANLVKTQKPDYLAMALDVSDETVFRKDLDANYKAQRDPAPEGLEQQFQRIVSIVEATNIPILRMKGFEADDIMATLAERHAGSDLDVYFVSRDKDLDQLLSEHVHLFDPVKGESISGPELLEAKGYVPEQAVDFQTLVGDTSDNVPGVPGVGPKTAIKLLGQYGSAEVVLEHADELTPKMRERVLGFAEQLPITRQLVTLRRDVPIEFDFASSAVEGFSGTGPAAIFEELGFTTVAHTFADVFGGEVDEVRAAARAGESESAETARDAGEYELIDTEEKLAALAEELSQLSCFAFDTETTGLSPVASELVGLSFSWKSGRACYVPVRASMGAALGESVVVGALKGVLEDASIGKVGHNLKYDIVVLKQVGVAVRGVVFDTLIGSFLTEPDRRSHSLDSLALAICRHEMIPITDLIGKGKKQISLDQLPAEQVGEYASEDADYSWRLFEHYGPLMASHRVKALFDEVELPLVDVLATMENNGVAVDRKKLSKLSETLGERVVELMDAIHGAAGRSFNIDSPKQLQVVLFDELGFEPVKKTKTGRSTDAETLQSLAAQGTHELPGLVLEYREVSKLRSTYVDSLPKMVCAKTGRIHASFHQTGAITGRLSSSDPNLQNIPVRTEAGRKIREAFVAAPGHLLVTADYSQIELRLLAHFSQDAALIEAFCEGQDIHRAVAAEVNGVELDEVTAAQRSAAKAVNFGIIYGQSAFGLSRSIGIPVGEARSFIETYFAKYPGIRAFIDKCVEDAKTHGYAETVLGRWRPIPELASRNRAQVAFGERIAVNTVVQGSAADLIKRAMVGVHRDIEAGEIPAKLLVQVHDELILEAAEGDAGAVGEAVRERMESAMDLDVPLVVDVGRGEDWAACK